MPYVILRYINIYFRYELMYITILLLGVHLGKFSAANVHEYTLTYGLMYLNPCTLTSVIKEPGGLLYINSTWLREQYIKSTLPM